MIKKVFLVGNPNVGKSVVFSRLTGVQVISSNYPGTTVEILKGHLLLGDEKLEVIDLPGSYSYEPASKAEEVVAFALGQEKKEDFVVLNVVDATNLERNLFLTLQLIEQGFFAIVCLNMYDETKHRGITIATQKLEERLGVPVVATCALTGMGVKHLIERIKEARQSLGVSRTHKERWQEIGSIIEETQQLEHRHHTFREMLEDISVKPITGLAIAALLMYGAFKVVRFLGEWMISAICDPVFTRLYQPVLETISAALGKKGFLHHVLIGELIKGKIDFRQSLGVLTTAPYIEFAMVLPYVASFYFILSLLEDSGYLPRLAILMDNILHRLGLHGYAIIPILLGFGCNVPGILSTRVLESKRERFIASTIISIGVPCVPLQAMIFGLLGSFGGLYVGGVYLVLFSLLLILGIILNRSLKGFSPEFLLEIPPYRLPPLWLLLKKLYFRIKGFLMEAMPVVLAGIFVINILLYVRLFDVVTNIFAPVIKGLFGLPKEAIVALTIGFLRKDVAVGMLMPLGLTAKQLFISATLLAISFPCVATFVVLFKELGAKDLLKAVLIMVLVSLVVGTLLNFSIAS